MANENNVLDVLAKDAPEAFTDIQIDDAGYISDNRLVRAKLGSSKSANQTFDSTYSNVRKIDIA